ncbi:hypothetical protein AB0I49_12310 [Streptomyces sp. NPDC050617]|uniref:hypothetical protein n=1 Tax=Streptomyces sp. NPDC050617 TaxID=3154628 RepID=UPI0034258552
MRPHDERPRTPAAGTRVEARPAARAAGRPAASGTGHAARMKALQSAAGNRAVVQTLGQGRPARTEPAGGSTDQIELADLSGRTESAEPAERTDRTENAPAPTAAQSTGTPAPAEAAAEPHGARKWVRKLLSKPSEKLETVKKLLDPIDFGSSRVVSPAVSGKWAEAAKDSDKAGTARAVEGTLATDVMGGAVDSVATVRDTSGALKAQGGLNELKEKKGVDWRSLRRDRNSKGGDAVQDIGTTVSDGIGMAKGGLKVAGNVAPSALGETAGALTIVISISKVVRDIRSVVRTHRMKRNLAGVNAPPAKYEGTIESKLLRKDIARARAAMSAPRAELAERQSRPTSSSRPDGGPENAAAMRRLEAEVAALTAQIEQLEAEAAEKAPAYEESAERIAEVGAYAVKKRGRRRVKKGVSATGNLVKVAGAGVSIAVFAGAIAVSSPVGWGLAAAAALLLGGLALYKAWKSVRKRYKIIMAEQEAAAKAGEDAHEAGAEQAEGAPAVPGADPAAVESATQLTPAQAMAKALAFWKSVGPGKRQRMAGELYDLANGGDNEVRTTARELLKQLNMGPDSLRMSAGDWEVDLKDPEQKEKWTKLIENRLAS